MNAVDFKAAGALRGARGGAVRKAVFPVAGFGTGILPATKAAPKELLPVVDKPLIHYAVEEALAAGAREMILITNRNKRAIEDHFDKAYELESVLAIQKRFEVLAELRGMFPPDVSFAFVRQSDRLGLGHALACARPLVGDEPFLVIVPDELVDAPVPAAAQLVETYARTRQCVVGVAQGGAGVQGLGSLQGAAISRRTYRVTDVSRTAVDGALGIAGRFVFTPDIFDYLETLAASADGEGDLIDAVAGLVRDRIVYAQELTGERFDCGSKLGYLAATLHFGLRHPVLGESFARLVRDAQVDVPANDPHAEPDAVRRVSASGAD